MAGTTVLVTMAGRGSRFRLAGYNVPKYRIEVRDRSLFTWSMESLAGFAREGAEFVFIHLREDDPRGFIDDECDGLGIERRSYFALDEVTDGQATTAMAAASNIADQSSPVVIYNIDTYVESEYLSPGSVHGAGWIPCFPGVGSQWSFARADDQLRVLEIREKQRISSHATIGLYWFDSFERYSDAYRRYYQQSGYAERGERYIAPLYNQLIADGSAVYVHPVPFCGVHPLGTPEEVERFKNETNVGGLDSHVQWRQASAGVDSLLRSGGT